MGSLQQHKNMNIDQETYALWRTYGRWEAWYMDKWTSTKILTEENILVLTTKEHIVHSVHSKQRTNGTHLRGL